MLHTQVLEHGELKVHLRWLAFPVLRVAKHATAGGKLSSVLSSCDPTNHSNDCFGETYPLMQ